MYKNIIHLLKQNWKKIRKKIKFNKKNIFAEGLIKILKEKKKKKMRIREYVYVKKRIKN